MAWFDFFDKPEKVEYIEDPRFKKVSTDISDFLGQSFATGVTPYGGQLTLQRPETFQAAERDVLGRLEAPVTSQYYGAEPLEAMKEKGIRKAEERYRKSVIEPLQEQMVKYGISSSYGLENPVFQAEQELQTQLGDIGTSYDVQIQNMLQQGQAFEEQARANELARAMQLTGIDIPMQQFDIGSLYGEFGRQQMQPYQTYLPMAMSYMGALQPQQQALQQIQAYNATRQSPYQQFLPQAIGYGLGSLLM